MIYNAGTNTNKCSKTKGGFIPNASIDLLVLVQGNNGRAIRGKVVVFQ